MKCPKCGGEIPFYDLHPNCKHCGVNIMYYTQNDGLIRDAKRTELEAAVARMIVARIKAQFIGGKLQIIRMIAVIGAICALMVPFAGVHYTAPFFDRKFSVGLIGLIQSFGDGMLMKLPGFMKSSMFSSYAAAAGVTVLLLLVIAIIGLVIFGAFCLGFMNLTKAAKVMKNTALVGVIVSAAVQIAVIIMNFANHDSAAASFRMGFGALVCGAVFAVIFLVNKALLKNGIEPVYRENDLKRKEMLKKVRSGEVDIDTLPLPVFESEEEREERIKALEEALKAEEEGKEI